MPTLAGFLNFIRIQMGISAIILPDNSPVIGMAYDVALQIVNLAMARISPMIYSLAVYNLGGSNIIEFAQDQPGAPNVIGSDPPAPYFAYLRSKWNMNDFVSGVVVSSSDESTSQSMVTQESFKNLQIGDLQYLKTPWGRNYLSFAQKAGPVFGMN